MFTFSRKIQYERIPEYKNALFRNLRYLYVLQTLKQMQLHLIAELIIEVLLHWHWQE